MTKRNQILVKWITQPAILKQFRKEIREEEKHKEAMLGIYGGSGILLVCAILNVVIRDMLNTL